MVALLQAFGRRIKVNPETPSHIEIPEQAVQEALISHIADLLQAAHDLGVAYANEQAAQERAIAFKAPGFLSLAQDIASRFMQRISDWVQSWFSDEGGDENPETSPDAELFDMIDTTAQTAALTEIPSIIGSGMLDTWQEQGVPDVVWMAEDEACEVCAANAAQGAIPIGSAFASGDAYPPAHPRCRCSLSMA